MASLFLSYDHGDAERAAPIARALDKAGHSVWWDRHIKGGAQYNDEIEAEVKKADVVVVLWSKHSVRSAWVRDEAAEGRDLGKLVPARIDAVKPPMGFRQFQTIDLTQANRGLTASSLRQLLDAIEALGGRSPSPSPAATAGTPFRLSQYSWRAGLLAAALAVVAIGAMLVWNWRSQPALAVVAVAASDSTDASQALARELVVKLGTLTHVASSKWQLADPQSAPTDTDLLFRVAETDLAAKPRASLVLLDGKRNTILWSREFAQIDGNEADLRLQLSLTAGRVLGCALEARETSGLRPDLLRLFLSGCAAEAETSNMEPHKVAASMRSIVDQQSDFKPAWSRLLLADTQTLSLAQLDGVGIAEARAIAAQDISKARKVVPDLRELKLMDLNSKPLSPFDHAGVLKAIAREKAVAPDMPVIWRSEADVLAKVGRLREAIESARRAAELDPLSPAATTELIYALAWGGQIDAAKAELKRAEQQWPGTGALRDAQWAFHLRYGDPRIAQGLRPGAQAEPYLRARLNPTPANINALVDPIQRSLSRSEFGEFGYALQALGEFHRTDEAFAWLNRTPREKVVEFSYLLFRPGLADVRRDPRFLGVAKRIGLLSYWRKSGKWPDFCSEPGLPYDCKKEAAKLAA